MRHSVPVLDDVIRPSVEQHSGRIFKTTGDGFLAVFASVNEALDGAIAIQAGFTNRPLQIRLGVNLGDVIEEGGDVFGDGVNIAARLEAMAPPRGIFVSSAVVQGADHSRSRQFRRVGRRAAKNIPVTLDVYALRFGENHYGSRLIRPVLRSFGKPLLLRASVALGLCLCAAGGIEAYSRGSLSDGYGTAMMYLTDTVYGQSGASVAVLPFDNMSGDTSQDYFADGLTEDIITELARNPELQVISRNSTFAMRESAVDVRQTGRRLGAAYIVEDSARRSGDQLRVAAQLVDARSGAHIWSQSYDRRVENVFQVQSELTAEIVSHLVSFVRVSEVTASIQRPTESLQAYDLVLQAREIYRSGPKGPQSLMTVRSLYQRALEGDPGYAAARAALGLTYILEGLRDTDDPAPSPLIDTGLSEARQAIRLNPRLADGFQVLSVGLSAKGDYSASMQAAKRAVDLNPNDPDSLMTLAKAQVRYEEYDQAVSNAERVRKLHLLAPEYYTYVYGQALYAAGRFDDAESVLSECLIRSPQDKGCLVIHAAVLVAQEKFQEARQSMVRLQQSDHDFSLTRELRNRRFGASALMDRFLSALTLANAPETAEQNAAKFTSSSG